jgi:hypothetical protein
MLQEDPGCQIGPLAGTANDMDLSVAGQFLKSCPELSYRDVYRFRYIFDCQLKLFAHVQDKSGFSFIPVTEWHITP